MTTELVIFDCDGVLIDSEVISARMLRAEAVLWGVDIPIEHILRHYVGRSYPKVLADIQTRFDITLPPDFEENYRARLLDAFEKDLVIIPQVRSVIEKLNVPCCVATSSSPARVRRSLELVGLWDLLQPNVFTSSQVAHGKPAPDLFLFAADKMGVATNRCMVIEDSLMGVKAGLAANMKTVRFTGGSHIIDKTEEAGAEFAFSEYDVFFDHFPELQLG